MRVQRVEEEEGMVRERRERAKQVREKQTRKGHRGQKGIERDYATTTTVQLPF